MIELSKSIGFCFGVKKSLEIVKNLIDSGSKIAILGNIINNEFVVNELKKQGVRTINSLNECRMDEILVFRSHGVDLKTYEDAKKLNLKFKDGCCPFVKKIHNIVNLKSDENSTVIIAGKKNHPEIAGIVGHCHGEIVIFESRKELVEISEKLKLKNKNIILISQTTFNLNVWNDCLKFARENFNNLKIYETICHETIKRQKEIKNFSKRTDLMIVVGGKNSSNTRKLYEIAKLNCETILIEHVDELKKLDVSCFKSRKKIGIASGASTPIKNINEIVNYVKKLN